MELCPLANQPCLAGASLFCALSTWRSAGILHVEAASSWNWNCKSAEAAASVYRSMSSCDCLEHVSGMSMEKALSPLLPPRSAQTVAQSSAGPCIWPGVRMSWFTSLCQVCMPRCWCGIPRA